MTSRAKLKYEERVLLEDLLNAGTAELKICEELGISSSQLEAEKRRGWVSSERKYSADKAQFSLM